MLLDIQNIYAFNFKFILLGILTAYSGVQNARGVAIVGGLGKHLKLNNWGLKLKGGWQNVLETQLLKYLSTY